jgi:Fe2+ transport system protein FeoA
MRPIVESDFQFHNVPGPSNIADLRPGQSGRVTRIAAAGALRQRLLDLGLLPDTLIHVERAAIGGDPLWIRCHGARLALRGSEARAIGVRVTP